MKGRDLHMRPIAHLEEKIISYPFYHHLAVPVLTIVIPTYNESDNVELLIGQLREVLSHIQWEVIFVDDNSSDGTANKVREIGKQDARVRCIKRYGRRGLSGACLEGMLASQAEWIAVMDGDLQHDESLLVHMLSYMQNNQTDLMIASRYLKGGSSGSFSFIRKCISKFCNALANYCMGASLSDPMSGFFMIRRECIDKLAPQLQTEGFKILFDILVAANNKLSLAELPYSFRKRNKGQSKLNSKVAFDFVSLILEKLTGKIVSGKRLLFALFNVPILILHLFILNKLLSFKWYFPWAQSITVLIMTVPAFYLNHLLMYRDERNYYRNYLKNLFQFNFVRSVRIISNICIASCIYFLTGNWWLAGMSGSIVGW